MSLHLQDQRISQARNQQEAFSKQSNYFWTKLEYIRNMWALVDTSLVPIVCFMLFCCLPYCFTLKMEAIYSSESSLDLQRLHGVISQKIHVFINTALSTSNSRWWFLCFYAIDAVSAAKRRLQCENCLHTDDHSVRVPLSEPEPCSCNKEFYKPNPCVPLRLSAEIRDFPPPIYSPAFWKRLVWGTCLQFELLPLNKMLMTRRVLWWG
jgi:hypothetical protein